MLIKLAKTFFDSTSPVNVISNSGCEIIKAMHSSKVDKDYENKQKDNKITLNDLRFLQFERPSIKSSFKLGKLPPTEGAAEQHLSLIHISYYNTCYKT